MATSDGLKQAHRHGPDAPADRRGCPGAETLARAAAGELQERERNLLARHIGDCRDCADEYRSLAPLRIWAEDARRSLAPGAPTSPPARWTASFALPHALAASLLLACLGLTTWSLSLRRESERLAQLLAEARSAPGGLSPGPGMVQAEADAAKAEAGGLRRQVEALTEPQLNAPIVDLESDAARGTAAPVPTVGLAPDAAWLTAILHSSSRDRFSSHAVAILDAHGRPIWQGTGLRRNADGTFTLLLPARLLPPGAYRLRVSGGSAPGRLLDEYPLRIRLP